MQSRSKQSLDRDVGLTSKQPIMYLYTNNAFNKKASFIANLGYTSVSLTTILDDCGWQNRQSSQYTKEMEMTEEE